MFKTNIKSYKHLISFALAAFIVTIILIWFYNSTYFADFKDWSQQNTIFYFLTLAFLKVVGIVWPPLPGGILTVGSIPIVGWEVAYLADFVGGTIGSALAFYISRKYGKKFLIKIFDEQSIEKLTNLKIKEKRQLEMLFITLALGYNIIEGIAYGSGLIKKIKFRNFLIARITSHVFLGIPTYYFAEKIISGESLIVSVVLILLLFPIMWSLRYRYIDL